jgi:hypothetical protein
MFKNGAGQFDAYTDKAPPLRARRGRGGRVVLMLLTVVWAAGISAGLLALWRYAHRPGVKDESPARWPVASQILRAEDRPTLLFFAHPQCPCTRASIRELERLTARLHRKVETHVIFIKPSELSNERSWTDLSKSAEAICEARVVFDHEGIECEQFRARTSGLTLLYSDTGELLFQGGITPSRGHEGDNDGIAAVEAILLNGRTRVRQTSVFGCPLQTPDFALRDP